MFRIQLVVSSIDVSIVHQTWLNFHICHGIEDDIDMSTTTF